MAPSAEARPIAPTVLRRDARSPWDEPPRFAHVGHARIAYRRVGSGPPLLLIHGWPFSSRSFRHLLPLLARDFTCWLPDTPGLGETTWTSRTGFRFAAQADTLLAFADAVGLERTAVLAFDTGATIARQMALVAPPRITRLVLLDTEIPHHRPPFIRLFQASTRMPGNLTTFRLLLASPMFRRSRMGFGGCFADRRRIDSADFLRATVLPLLASPSRLDGVTRYLQGIDWMLVDGMATRHAELHQPVLFVWGADDQTFPLALARRMATQLPSCAGVVAVPHARLLVHEEQPAAVADAAVPFLRGG